MSNHLPSLTPHRLKLPSEDPNNLDRWKSDILLCPVSRQIELPRLLVAGIEQISTYGGRDTNWWANRLLFIEYAGRTLLEQIEPLTMGQPAMRQTQANCDQSVQISGALVDLIAAHDCSSEGDLQRCIAEVLERRVWGVKQVGLADAERIFGGPDDSSIKIWLPDSVYEVIRLLASHWGHSASDVLRNLLLEHMVGRCGYISLVSSFVWRSGRRADSTINDGQIMFSHRITRDKSTRRRSANIAAYGKSTEDIKLWCPSGFRESLAAIATDRGIRLSDYAREVITTSLFGKLVSSSSCGLK